MIKTTFINIIIHIIIYINITKFLSELTRFWSMTSTITTSLPSSAPDETYAMRPISTNLVKTYNSFKLCSRNVLKNKINLLCAVINIYINTIKKSKYRHMLY